jgi:lipoprotein-releasing system permease protein
MVLIVVLAVMSGLETSLKEKILGINAHIWVLPQLANSIEGYQEIVAKIANIPHVTLAAPFTTHEVMLMVDGRAAGTIVRGIDPTNQEQRADFAPLLHGQDLRQLLAPAALAGKESDTSPTVSPRGIVLGKELARNLLVFPGQQVVMNSPLGMLTPAGILPNMRRFTVTGTFETGMYEYDAKLALISLQHAQEFFDLGNTAHGIEVKVDDIYRAPQVAQTAIALLGPAFGTRDWMQMNRSLFAALRQEKVLMFIILVLIILVAAFNIASTLIMMVMEKHAAIAILKTMGAHSASIHRIFMFQGFLIGLVGTIVGTIAGLAFAWNLPAIEKMVGGWLGIDWFPSDVYLVDQLPVEIHPLDVSLIVLIALGVSFLATLYPAWSAARLDPVVALRYE